MKMIYPVRYFVYILQSSLYEMSRVISRSGLARSGLIPSLNPALSSTYERTDTLNNSGLIKIMESILISIERAGAGQWRFKKDIIDKWISEQSLERVKQNIKSS
ncbi:MAG: hypothetical protein ACUVQT_10700, partial [bacterium]